MECNQWNKWTKKIKLVATENKLVVIREELAEMGEGDQLYHDRWLLDLLWWSFCSVYKYWIIVLYILNKYNGAYQFYLNKSSFIKKKIMICTSSYVPGSELAPLFAKKLWGRYWNPH